MCPVPLYIYIAIIYNSLSRASVYTAKKQQQYLSQQGSISLLFHYGLTEGQIPVVFNTTTLEVVTSKILSRKITNLHITITKIQIMAVAVSYVQLV